MPRKYPEVFCWHRSRFWTNELVKARDRGLAIDGDIEPARPRPRNSELIERRAVQCADVVRAVREVVANTADTAIVCDDAAAIAVDQAADELLGGFFDQYFL